MKGVEFIAISSRGLPTHPYRYSLSQIPAGIGAVNSMPVNQGRILGQLAVWVYKSDVPRHLCISQALQ